MGEQNNGGELDQTNSPLDLRVKIGVLLDSHFLFAHFERVVDVAQQGREPFLNDGIVVFEVIGVEKLFDFF